MDLFSSAKPEQLWHYLGKIAQDSGHPARVISLASVDQQGAAQVRSVILREVEPWSLSVYTDSRSPKVAQLRQDPRAEILIWDPDPRWQLRFSAQAEVVLGPETDRLWQRIKGTSAASDYLAPQAPGAPLASETEALDEPAIAILRFKVIKIDWLELNPSGHRRQRLTPDGVEALVP